MDNNNSNQNKDMIIKNGEEISEEARSREEITKRAGVLFLQHYEYVRNVVYRVAPVPGVQEDIVQEVFLAFVESANRWDLEQDVRPLLYSIAKKAAMNHYRKYVQSIPEGLRQLAQTVREESEKRLDPAWAPMELSDQFDALESCTNRLKGLSRIILDSHYKKSYSFAEIAEKTNVKLSTVHRIMSRVRLFLRECIESVLRGRSEHESK
ncbi:MAG: sigma-70 family RNA polymerase sigma factor [Planctomycetia bacterium]|nr:sigma-70 family RNA polymerase sigma factor [Planctomycetia bacterium]